MSTKSMLMTEPQIQQLEPVEFDQNYLLQFMDVVNNAVWLIDPNLHLMAQNEAAAKMVGWSSAEVVGRSICELVPSSEDSLCGLRQLLSQAIEKQQAISFERGMLLATKKKEYILVEGRMSPIIQGNQTVAAVCAFWQVVPEQENTYLRFEFADMASHLLRTPLSFIQTSIDLLMTAKLDANEQQAMLSRMRKQNQRLRNFVNELLKMLRLETEGIQAFTEPISLLPLIERVLNLIRYEQPHHVFNFISNGTLSMVVADATKTELILLNLLLSAVRRCPNGGSIAVQATERTSEVVISILDNGESIPTKLLDKAFWQFYPVDEEVGKIPSSYQLGLYTTKQLVELQSGRIWAESQPGQGSKFSFSIPIWEKGQ